MPTMKPIILLVAAFIQLHTFLIYGKLNIFRKIFIAKEEDQVLEEEVRHGFKAKRSIYIT